MIAISKVYVDRRENVLDASFRPEFSFSFESRSEGQVKTIRYTVSSSSALEGDIYSAKERPFKREFGIFYQGPSLLPRHEYFVNIILGLSDGSEISKSVSFLTRLAKEDWKGTWIGGPQTWNGGGLSIRRELESFQGKKVRRALAYVAGIGYSEFYVNGKKMGDEVLGPGVTTYDKHILYRTYDIKEYLQGENDVIGVLLGYGWYGKRILNFQLYIDFEDGTEAEYHSYSNYNWWFSPSPITANSIYSGESYDARMEDVYPGGFTNPKLRGNYTHMWFGSVHSEQTHGQLVPQEIDPIRVKGEFPGTVLSRFSESNLVYDVKQNLAGFCRIEVKGKRGAKIILRHAETLKDDGHIDQTNLRTADQEDTYILKGEGVETYAPRFTYHGFRYVEAWIEGEAEILSLTALHVHTDSRKIGEFSCSDPDLNRLHRMAVITEENNQHSILTDCPQRDERFGWMNDLSTRLFQNAYNFDMLRFYRKFIVDVNETQNLDGSITDTAPYYTGGRPADTTSLSYLLLAELGYINFGDKKIIKDNYPHLKKWVEFLLTHQKGYIMDYAYYADWVSCVNYPDAASDPIQISSYFLFWHLKTLAHLAEILGKKKDAQHYARLAAESRNAINEKYFHQDHYGSNVQAENSMALSLGICPKNAYAKVYASLRQSIIDHDYHLTSGNQGYRHSMYLLCENGDVDLLLKVLKNPAYPGWGFMLQNDATSVWERWEKENQATMNSFDHPMFGSYDCVFYRYLLGIKIDDIYRNCVRIEPVFPESLTEASGSLDTPRGKIEVSYKKQGDEIEYTLFLPVSMKARVLFKDKEAVYRGKRVPKTGLLLRNGEHRFVLR